MAGPISAPCCSGSPGGQYFSFKRIQGEMERPGVPAALVAAACWRTRRYTLSASALLLKGHGLRVLIAATSPTLQSCERS
ncbi:hypothetical protein [Dictyobacter vulcani]|uniref:hypothetical protein n=1 Tax=Dictyobacter vulcani TaxID=2607529 RepID=UPI00125015E8|nr:hypothetical protein [Dictyobacter vulcani]